MRILVVTLIVGLSGCGGRGLVLLTVEGTQPNIDSLTVTAENNGATAGPMALPGAAPIHLPQSYALGFDATRSGTLTLTVQAWSAATSDHAREMLGCGTRTTAIAPGNSFPVTLPLDDTNCGYVPPVDLPDLALNDAADLGMVGPPRDARFDSATPDAATDSARPDLTHEDLASSVDMSGPPDLAPGWPVFYYDVTTDSMSHGTVRTVDSLNGKTHTVSCTTDYPATSVYPTVPATDNNPNGSYLSQMYGMRSWYPMATSFTPGSSLFVYTDQVPGSSTSFFLRAIHDTSTCTGTPTHIDNDTTSQHGWIRIAPAGNRVAYMEWAPDNFGSIKSIKTVDIDGQHPSTVYTPTAKTEFPWFAAPTWNGTNLNWIVQTNYVTPSSRATPNLKLYSLDDCPTQSICSAAPQVACDFKTTFVNVDQIEFVDKNRVLMMADMQPIYQATTSTANSDIYLLLLSTACPGGAFNLGGTVNLTQTAAGEIARDFALSPDGVTLAFAASYGNPAPSGQPANQQATDIYLLNLNQPGKTTLCGGIPASPDVAPQWIANGKQLAWTRIDTGTVPGALMIADVSGGQCKNMRALITNTTNSEVVMTGTSAGGGCSTGGPVEDGIWTWLLVLAALSLVMRPRAQALKVGVHHHRH